MIINLKERIIEFYVPKNLELTSLLAQRGYSDWITNIRINKLLWIISSIHCERLTEKRYKEKDSFARLNYDVLAKIISTNYVREAIEVLSDCGIIEVDRHYIIKKR